MQTTVELTRSGLVATIEFQGPRGIQTLSAATRAELNARLDDVECDHELRILQFTASGRTFIAGADIRELAELDPDSALRVAREGQSLMQRIAALPFPTIAVIQGACAGGGCELALACSQRIATEDARIGLPEAGLGLLPGWGGTVRSTHLFGSAIAQRLVQTGELFVASEAHRMGLVSAVVTADTLSDHLVELHAQILKQSPDSIRLASRVIAATRPVSLDAFEAEAQAFADCYRNGHAQIGLQAFLAKQPAAWVSVNPGEPDTDDQTAIQ